LDLVSGLLALDPALAAVAFAANRAARAVESFDDAENPHALMRAVHSAVSAFAFH
jgi:hypothetical protein